MGLEFSNAELEATNLLPSAEAATYPQRAPGTLFEIQVAPKFVEV